MTRVYVTDLDGTLLDPSARLSPATRDGLLRLLDAGVHVTIATARSLASMQEILRGIPLELPVVEMCGAALTRFPDGERLEVADLSPDVADDVRRSGCRSSCGWKRSPARMSIFAVLVMSAPAACSSRPSTDTNAR